MILVRVTALKPLSEFDLKFDLMLCLIFGLKVKVTQSCLTLCDPMDYTVHGILQARILEWVAVPFSRVSSQPRDETQSPILQADYLPAEPPGMPQYLV